MEKCTFCVQRLTEAKSKARTEKRTVRDGEVVTACAQACPTSAIHFGNIADSSSTVAKMWKAQQVELSADRQEKDERGKRRAVRRVGEVPARLSGTRGAAHLSVRRVSRTHPIHGSVTTMSSSTLMGARDE